MTRFLALLLLLGSCNIANSSAEPANQLVAKVVERLVMGESLSGEFLQEKHLVFLQKPFVSSGEFCADHLAGLRWQVREPLASLMVVDGTKVLLDGELVEDHGIGQLMRLIMIGVMEGRLDEVEDYFDITGDLTPSEWKLSLTPRSLRLKSVLQYIELRGDNYLREIEIFERDDNRTMIVLTNMRAQDANDSSANACTLP